MEEMKHGTRDNTAASAARLGLSVRALSREVVASQLASSSSSITSDGAPLAAAWCKGSFPSCMNETCACAAALCMVSPGARCLGGQARSNNRGKRRRRLGVYTIH